jgi:hypothetical protein
LDRAGKEGESTAERRNTADASRAGENLKPREREKKCDAAPRGDGRYATDAAGPPEWEGEREAEKGRAAEREGERDLEKVGHRRDVSARAVASDFVKQFPVLAQLHDGYPLENTQSVNRNLLVRPELPLTPISAVFPEKIE